MNRRETLEHLSVILGGSITLPIASGFLAGCQAGSDPNAWAPKALTKDQSEILGSIAERIIPKTDTPGATDASVIEFLDLIVSDWFDEKERKAFFDGMAESLTTCQSKNGKDLLDLAPEEQTAFLAELDAEFFNSDTNPSGQARFMNTMKQFTVVGYYTSEIGATQELRQPIMGEYVGCIPVDETTRTWAW